MNRSPDRMRRRTLLRLGAALGAPWSAGWQPAVAARAEEGLMAADLAEPSGAASAPALIGRARQRVLIIGGAWAGLAAAHGLRQQAPELDVTVIDRAPVLRSLPLSSPWLVDRTPERAPRLDLAALGARQGWRFVAAEVMGIDRVARQVHTAQGALGYDWLVLAAGLDYDDGAWYGGDAGAQSLGRERFPAGFVASELDLLKARLMAFAEQPGGGELVMTVPPPPMRCPPAPYERAMLIGWWIKRHGLKAKLTVLDAGPGMPRYNRLMAERYAGQIVHRPYAEVRQVDPVARTLSSDDGDLRFDHALLLPTLRASALVHASGLAGLDGTRRPTRWAAVDPLTGGSPLDDRIWLAGDLLDAVSPLFAYYPKTAHVAADLGAAVARQIAARSRGEPAPAPLLPQSECHVWLDADPPEQLQIEAGFRLRGDGVLAQALRQTDNPQPRDEDALWLRRLLAQRLGVG